MRILFFNYETALGSALHATPIFASLLDLVNSHSNLEINAVSGGICADVISGHPSIKKVWITPHPFFSFWKTIVWFIENRQLLGRYDKIIFNSSNCRTKLLLLSYLVKANTRSGFAVKGWLVNTSIKYNDKISLIQNNLNVLPLLGINNIVKSVNPEIYYTKNEQNKVQTWLGDLGLNYTNKPIIGLFVGTSGGHPNNWFDDRFIDLTAQLIADTDATCIFFGGKNDIVHIEGISSRFGSKAVSFAGKTTVKELAAFCAVCDLIITLDTGGMHIGWAIGTPMIVIGHSAEPSHVWLPWGNNKITIIRKDDKVACAFCRKKSCETRECMQEITVEEVVAASKNKLMGLSTRERLLRLEKWVL